MNQNFNRAKEEYIAPSLLTRRVLHGVKMYAVPVTIIRIQAGPHHLDKKLHAALARGRLARRARGRGSTRQQACLCAEAPADCSHSSVMSKEQNLIPPFNAARRPQQRRRRTHLQHGGPPALAHPLRGMLVQHERAGMPAALRP